MNDIAVMTLTEQEEKQAIRDEKGTTIRLGIYEKYGKNTMKDYKYPAKDLLDMVYPKFLRELQKRKKI